VALTVQVLASLEDVAARIAEGTALETNTAHAAIARRRSPQRRSLEGCLTSCGQAWRSALRTLEAHFLLS
jgi:hypothetical protein